MIVRVNLDDILSGKRQIAVPKQVDPKRSAVSFATINPWFKLHRYRGCDPAWFECWKRTIPRFCKCQEGFSEIEKRLPADFSSPDAFFLRGVEWHNEVNAKLDGVKKRYPQVSIDEAKRLWRSDFALWQPVMFGGLERWSISISSKLSSFGTIVDGKIGDHRLAESLFAVSPSVRLVDACKHGTPIIMSCVKDAKPILDADVTLLAHGYCDWTRQWVESSHAACRRLVGVSQVVAKNVSEWTGRHCDVIENGIDSDRIISTMDKQSSRQRLGIPADAFVVGYTGRLAKEKQIQKLVSAIERMDNTYLLLCGWQTEFSRKLDLSKIKDRCIAIPPIDQIGDVLVAMDCFASLPTTEGFGLSVMEAMQFGLPVVSTRKGVIEDLSNKHGEFGPSILQDHFSTADLIRAIEQARKVSVDLSFYTADAMANRWKTYLGRECNVLEPEKDKS